MIERAEYNNKRFAETDKRLNRKEYFVCRKAIKLQKEPR